MQSYVTDERLTSLTTDVTKFTFSFTQGDKHRSPGSKSCVCLIHPTPGLSHYLHYVTFPDCRVFLRPVLTLQLVGVLHTDTKGCLCAVTKSVHLHSFLSHLLCFKISIHPYANKLFQRFLRYSGKINGINIKCIIEKKKKN